MDDKQNNIDLLDAFEKDYKTDKSRENDYQDLIEKYCFLISYLSEELPSTLRHIVKSYKEEFDKDLFTPKTTPEDFDATWFQPKNDGRATMLAEFIEQTKNSRDDDYGWLEPDGTFHPSPWGTHTKWAQKYLDKHYPITENRELYYATINNRKQPLSAGDVLAYNLNWVLIDSPSQGFGYHRENPNKPLTKAQKEFLYDYYMERGRNKEANAIWNN